MEYFVTCSHEFLKAVKANGWPLDFFSFHSYSAPEEALRQIRFADEHLNEYGFTADRTERHFNEWLPYVNHDNLGTAKQASGIATELIELQNGPCAVACIYDARCGLGNYSPLFNPMTYKPHKAYYAFMAFNELRKLGQAVKATTDGTKGLSVCAAKKGNAAAIFCANDTDQPMPSPASWMATASFRSVIRTARRRMPSSPRTISPLMRPCRRAPSPWYC